ncbi:uncharacterized protein N7458_010736 [Penicillium daleae]|uniref:Uncharacterized protein n=1 Tax=Penicillium daleae TaxID=63821 RepID=A0AAD6FZB6_9EURO|nr:uncharacterized protein N7458_010736 [Penicillium daleae]KAJ5439738.1 hypothetical protein N7458_010736 [Penicillium daleae]
MASGVLVSHVKANGEQLLVVYLLFCGAREQTWEVGPSHEYSLKKALERGESSFSNPKSRGSKNGP